MTEPPSTMAALYPVQGPEAPPDCLGPYRLLRRLAEGGMGSVFEAEDRRLGRRVAVKVIRADLASDPVHRERFLRESRAAANLSSDHVVPVLHAAEEGGTPYLAMPLLAGETLAARLKRGPLPPAEVVELGRQVALGLAAAHAAGLVHRDVKPANIWLEPCESGPPRARLFDFGLARSPSEPDALTAPGGVAGTPAYMAPEQARGLRVDARTDLFSLGVVLYEAATGHLPPAAAPPRPPALAAMIDELMRNDPARRPGSAAAVAARLAALGYRRPRRAAVLVAAALAALAAVPVVLRRPAPPETTEPVAPPTATAEPVAAEPPPEPGAVRLAAEHVLRRGGSLFVTAPNFGRYVSAPEELPAEPFQTPQVILRGRGEFTTADAAAVQRLPGLRDLYLGETKTAAPLLRRVTGVAGRSLRGLELGAAVTTADLSMIAEREPALEWLFIGTIPGEPDGFLALARLPRLVVLTADNNAFPPGLFAAMRCPDLESLDVNFSRGFPDAALAGAEARFPKLILLHAEGTELTAAGVRSAARLPRLESFSSTARDAGDAELAALASAPLKELWLRDGRVTGRGLAAFRGKPLEKLILTGHPLAEAELAALAEMPSLRELSLVGARGVRDATLLHLRAARALRSLDLTGTGVTEGAVRAFSEERPECRVDWNGQTFGPRQLPQAG